ncbi:MAG TPA: hypothetical protein DDY39_17300, partial [Nitrospira sp.]|nr:hypothetical protein [Nitrospira sp.]
PVYLVSRYRARPELESRQMALRVAEMWLCKTVMRGKLRKCGVMRESSNCALMHSREKRDGAV